MNLSPRYLLLIPFLMAGAGLIPVFAQQDGPPKTGQRMTAVQVRDTVPPADTLPVHRPADTVPANHPATDTVPAQHLQPENVPFSLSNPHH